MPKEDSSRPNTRRTLCWRREHSLATFNNTQVTITDMQEILSAGPAPAALGFKGSRQSTAYAAQQSAQERRASGDGDGMKGSRNPCQRPRFRS